MKIALAAGNAVLRSLHNCALSSAVFIFIHSVDYLIIIIDLVVSIVTSFDISHTRYLYTAVFSFTQH